MVVEEHIVIRRPILFMVIVLAVLFAIFIPAKYIIEKKSSVSYAGFVNESYSDVWYWFNINSPLTADEKKELFDIKYSGNIVEWSGKLLNCRSLESLSSVSVEHRSTGFADVVFSTGDDCSSLPEGSEITYQIELIDLRVNVFVGRKGKIISSSPHLSS